jgi:SAM-dependent methyltransferase
MYDIDIRVAELYDQLERDTQDVDLIQGFMNASKPVRILEPFCGTGRILIPLALAGHQLHGLDQAKGMLARARMKVALLPDKVKARIQLEEMNVTEDVWPRGFDVLILGGNCFYELGSPEEQESCVITAARSLKPGGYVYVDNNHHPEGPLSKKWQVEGVFPAFPTGISWDGTHFESTKETIWWDVEFRLIKIKREINITFADGRVAKKEMVQHKHPVSKEEVAGWLENHGFEIIALFGDRQGNLFDDESNRAIFWARKK